MKLPVQFEAKMKQLLGAQYPEYLACFGEPRYYGLRVNTNKVSAEEFERICPFEIRRIPWIPNGFYFDGERVSPAKHPYYFAGLYYLQEPSAMTPASRLPVEPGDRVLDLCAAPGGKATELGVRLRGKGVLAANDLSASRAKGLLKNLEMFGIGNALVLSEEPGKLSGHFPQYFDKILIDAPCSGEGMFRKDAKMIKAWEAHGPEFFAKIQKNIITQAAQMLRPGGQMLYSTCTFDERENEQVIGHLMRACPEFCVVPMEGYEGFAPGGIANTVRIFPHRMQGEGHFLALLLKRERKSADAGDREAAFRRKAGCGAVPPAGQKPQDREIPSRKLPEEFWDFFRQARFALDEGRLDVRQGRVYYMPEEAPDMKGLRILRAGLFLGELKKRRFEPSQALAMYLKKEDYARCMDFPSADGRAARYLRGETLDVGDMAGRQEKGWYLICVDGFPLGWGKLSGGVLKNKYLPEWRMR